MNKIIVCVIVISLIISVSIYFYDFYLEHVKEKDKLSSVVTPSENKQVFQDNIFTSDSLHDEDVKYLLDKGWNVHHVRNAKNSRNIRSLASIANCLWRVLNYPYMYNFYPILNFGVGKIMSGLGSLINNVHFPLFSSCTSTTSQQPMSDAESQAQQLAYAQGQALSQEGSTGPPDYTGGDTSNNKAPTAGHAKTQSQEYQDEKDEEIEEEKEKEEALKQKLRQQEVNKKIDAKAAILAKKYVQMYFSQNTQDISLSNQNNLLGDATIDLANSLDNEAGNPTTDLYDFNAIKNYALPNNANNMPVYN